jgi:prepilin peptidase CpaA
MAPAQMTLWLVLGVALLISLVTDVLPRRIPDAITYPTVGVALGVRLLWEGVGNLEQGLVSGLLSALALLAVFSVLAWRGRMGGGDAMLMGAVGAALGYPLALAALMFISLVGALQAAVTLVWQGAVWDTLSASARRWVAKVRRDPAPAQASPGRRIPYGVAIALGSFWAMWWERSGVR